MPATLPPAKTPMAVIQRTTTAYSEESRKLYDLRTDIIRENEVTASWRGGSVRFDASEETGIHAEADCMEPRTLEDLAEARRRFLASIQSIPMDADLPAVLLTEG